MDIPEQTYRGQYLARKSAVPVIYYPLTRIEIKFSRRGLPINIVRPS